MKRNDARGTPALPFMLEAHSGQLASSVKGRGEASGQRLH